MKQILCIKLVKYWDKYTEMHGQQNVKKNSLSCFFYCCILRLIKWLVLPYSLNSAQSKLDWGVCTSLTQLYDGRDMCRIYYIKNNYMFRLFTSAIVRLRSEKNLVSSHTRVMWLVYSREVLYVINSIHISTII